MRDGTCWGIPNFYEWDHAEELLNRFPGLDQVRYTNSGTEAVMTAVRVARAGTGRDGCIVARGAYHGTSEVALCAGGDHYTRGVPRGVIDDVTVLPLNDVAALRASVEQAPRRYAAIAIDLLPNRAGLVSVSEEFVRTARELATRHGIVLLIDEVISLRLGERGLSGIYGVEPDLVTVGKIIGGGFPVGAVLGREELMRELNPVRPNCLPHGGTFSGNPVSMAAGAESLRLLSAGEIARLNALGDSVRESVAAKVAAVGWEVRGRGSLLRPFPSAPVTASERVQQHLWWAAYDRGLLLSPANLAALSTPMTDTVAGDLAERLADAILDTAKNAAVPQGGTVLDMLRRTDSPV
jgi:glutamate-1-semialdehyde 2,1-aminomutase